MKPDDFEKILKILKSKTGCLNCANCLRYHSPTESDDADADVLICLKDGSNYGYVGTYHYKIEEECFECKDWCISLDSCELYLEFDDYEIFEFEEE
jgi:hypothetical protein